MKRELGTGVSVKDAASNGDFLSCGSRISTINDSGVYDFFCPRTKINYIAIEDDEMAPGHDTQNGHVMMYILEVEIFGFSEFGKSLKLKSKGFGWPWKAQPRVKT